jgi:predicted ester cyclase
MADVVRSLRGTLPDMTFTIEDIVGDGSRAATRWTIRGTDGGGLFALPATFRSVEFSGIFIDQVETDQITAHWGTSDMLGLLQQLGIVPADWDGDRLLS